MDNIQSPAKERYVAAFLWLLEVGLSKSYAGFLADFIALREDPLRADIARLKAENAALCNRVVEMKDEIDSADAEIREICS